MLGVDVGALGSITSGGGAIGGVEVGIGKAIGEGAVGAAAKLWTNAS